MVSSTTRSAIAMLSLAACGPAAALGFGEFRAQAFLGQPLNLAVPVALGEGESLSSDCASAEVVAGDVKLPVRVRITQGRDSGEVVIRVSTSVPIDEPVINVVVGAGCPPRMSRSLVLFADPPMVSIAATPATTSEPPSAAPAAPRSAAGPTGAAAPGQGTPSAERASRPAPPPRSTRLAQRPAAGTVTPAPASAAGGPAAKPSAEVSAAAKPAAPPRGTGRSRLQLDSAQISASAATAAAQAAQEQASATQLALAQAEAAVSAAQQRMKEMDAEMARLREQGKAQTDALAALRLQIEQDQAQRRKDAWLLPLVMTLAGVLALVAAWLAWRLRQQQAQPAREVWWERSAVSRTPGEDSSFRQSTYRPTAQPSGQVALPSAPGPLSMVGVADTMVEDDPRISPPTVPAPPMTPMTPVARAHEEESSRAVSVDEQIDLEQQADFFIALGHDESAIDLLMAHLRSTGGGTPLPFLKLLEIHRRRNDREAYERTRVRFNQRFNSVAPDWTSDPRAGRSLEDYPLVVGRIQHVWPKPLDAMAELESFLFRRGVGSEMFDLPAYQEVLFLYQLARDLHQAEQPDSGSDVDVLLPIGLAAAPVPQGTIMLRPEFSGGQSLMLDLDLTNKTEPELNTAPATPDLELEIDPKAPARDADPNDPWVDDPDDRRRE
jgi:hypothetical protein